MLTIHVRLLFLLLMNGQVIEICGLSPIHPSLKDGRTKTYQGGSDSRLWASTTPSSSRSSNNCSEDGLPKLVIFDLDGCLWRPEMYELVHFSGKKGAPFTPAEHDDNVLLTVAGEPVQLLKDVREVMKELYLEPRWNDILVGISSRTDAPHWAKELLEKFSVRHDSGEFVLEDVFRNGPIEMRSDSKVQHFQRIARTTNIGFEDMIFLDNEYGNCESVAALGVTVGYCPGGVSREIWQATLDAFPAGRGKVVRL